MRPSSSHRPPVAINSTFRDFVLEQLRRVRPEARARPMFGGAGLYADQVIFGLIAHDTLYFKTDAESRREFEARGMRPFRPFGETGAAMSYHQVPEDVLEDPEALAPWVERALAVARRSKARPPQRRSSR